MPNIHSHPETSNAHGGNTRNSNNLDHRIILEIAHHFVVPINRQLTYWTGNI
jgi:hypothetical protein